MFPSQFRRRRGFTLAEILTVLVILGIASAIIIPQIGTRSDLIAAAAARSVMADMLYAQNRAIATQKPHFIEFNGQTYTVSTRDTSASALYTITNPISNAPYTVTLGAQGSGLANASIASVSFSSQTMMGFDELGSPFSYIKGSNTMTPMAETGTVTISSGPINLQILVEPYTGELTVQ
jgi:prepilin-type N-terminal cleavage/methylation domain-containing protein